MATASVMADVDRIPLFQVVKTLRGFVDLDGCQFAVGALEGHGAFFLVDFLHRGDDLDRFNRHDGWFFTLGRPCSSNAGVDVRLLTLPADKKRNRFVVFDFDVVPKRDLIELLACSSLKLVSSLPSGLRRVTWRSTLSMATTLAVMEATSLSSTPWGAAATVRPPP